MEVKQLYLDTADKLRLTGDKYDLVTAMFIEQGFTASCDAVASIMRRAKESGENEEMTPGVYVNVLVRMTAVEISTLLLLAGKDPFESADLVTEYFHAQLQHYLGMGMIDPSIKEHRDEVG